jgi:hypothetical protein
MRELAMPGWYFFDYPQHIHSYPQPIQFQNAKNATKPNGGKAFLLWKS